MRAGRLDRTIVVERAVTTFDAARTPIEAWTALATLRAELLDARTEEGARDPGASIDAVLVFRTRYAETISPADRVRYQNALHDIIEVREIGRRRGLEIRCSTRRT